MPPPPQVCNLSWSKNINELVSTHGYSQNQIIAWRYPSMQARRNVCVCVCVGGGGQWRGVGSGNWTVATASSNHGAS